MTIDKSTAAKIRFNCRRGMGELEDILYPFFDNYFANLSVEQQQEFADLLTSEDTELWDWLVTKQAEPPAKHQQIVELINNAA